MKPIKIVDKLTLRQEALRMATKRASDNNHITSTLKLAKKYEDYLRGSADLPEYEDTHKDFKEMLGKMQESFNSVSRSMWISVDSEMRPADNMPVIVKIDETDGYFIGKYTRELGWEVTNAPYNHSIVAWTPVPPFVEPLKL